MSFDCNASFLWQKVASNFLTLLKALKPCERKVLSINKSILRDLKPFLMKFEHTDCEFLMKRYNAETEN